MVKNKNLIALDLDGTLLTTDKKITNNTKEYLNKLEKEGNLIVLCSGRAPRSVYRYYDFLNLKSPIISYNGSLVIDPKIPSFNKISYKLEKNFLLNLYKEIINKEVVSILAENEDTIFCDKEDDFLFAFFEKANMKIINGPFDKVINCDTFTFVMKLKNENEETKKSLLKSFDKINKDNKYRLRFWRDCPYAEIHIHNISKAATLNLLVERENINKENVFVFGDADNDIEMLSMFKNSFLMINGNPKIRKYATYLTTYDNDHDGIIYELKKFFN